MSRPRSLEFPEALPPDVDTSSGLGAMGHPIPAYRRQAGYDFCRSLGLTQERATEAVSGVAGQLERDEPYYALELGMKFLDLTGAYRLFAILLTGSKPRIRVPMETA